MYTLWVPLRYHSQDLFLHISVTFSLDSFFLILFSFLLNGSQCIFIAQTYCVCLFFLIESSNIAMLASQKHTLPGLYVFWLHKCYHVRFGFISWCVYENKHVLAYVMWVRARYWPNVGWPITYNFWSCTFLIICMLFMLCDVLKIELGSRVILWFITVCKLKVAYACAGWVDRIRWDCPEGAYGHDKCVTDHVNMSTM